MLYISSSVATPFLSRSFMKRVAPGCRMFPPVSWQPMHAFRNSAAPPPGWAIAGGVAAGMPGEAAAAPRRSDAAKSGAAAHRLAASARELRLQQHTNLLLWGTERRDEVRCAGGGRVARGSRCIAATRRGFRRLPLEVDLPGSTRRRHEGRDEIGLATWPTKMQTSSLSYQNAILRSNFVLASAQAAFLLVTFCGSKRVLLIISVSLLLLFARDACFWLLHWILNVHNDIKTMMHQPAPTYTNSDHSGGDTGMVNSYKESSIKSDLCMTRQ